MQGEDIIDRIKWLIGLSGLSVNAYARKVDVNPQTLYKCVGGRLPSVELVQNILAASPELSAEWLLMGRGAMRKQDTATLLEQLQVKDGQISRLIEKIGPSDAIRMQ